MTDRYNALTVVLEMDIRSDDAEPLLKAISMLKGVLSVTPNTVSIDSWIANERAKRELGEKLWAIIYPPKP